VPGVYLCWELMAGNSHCRWYWGTKDGTPEPPIPWCGLMWPDGSPVLLAEAEAIRAYTTGERRALFFDDFQDQPPPRRAGWTHYGRAAAGSRWLSLEPDAISDNGTEVYNLLQQLGIKNLIIMGVHTNMCIIGRSFAIKAMTRWGVRCVLVRDLTDAMYNPRRRPFVSHERGTELVVEHIEKHWCPSILSDDLLKVYPPKQ